jgi:hypothetical protein
LGVSTETLQFWGADGRENYLAAESAEAVRGVLTVYMWEQPK